MKRIGILGGGQLGLLLAQSVARLGAEVAVYDPDPDAPAAKQTFRSFQGSWTDEKLLAQFFDECDLITYEFENVRSELLFELEKRKPMHPSASVLHTTQNRAREKNFIAQNGLPHPQFLVLPCDRNMARRIEEFGLPCIVKTTFGGYDGKGQFLLEAKEDVERLVDKMFGSSKVKDVRAPAELICEEKIDLLMEVSCIVGRSKTGEEVVFPIFENEHKDHILDLTILPARLPHVVQEELKAISRRSAALLDVQGLLTVEFFLTKTQPRTAAAAKVNDWYILVNEFAPRPHNSGHITKKACDLSQFDIHARVLLDVPLREPSMVSDRIFAMGNLLGDVWLAQNQRPNKQLDLSPLSDCPDVIDVVLYGKTEARSKRKMGHFIVQGIDYSEVVRSADEFRNALSQSTAR